MFPILFPGIFGFITSYIKIIILASLVVTLTGFVSYHYVSITWYEKKFDQMTKEIRAYKIDIDNWKKKGFYTQDSITQITLYYERELEKCKSQLKREGELKKDEILNSNSK